MTRLLLRSASVTKDSALAASCDKPLAAGRVGSKPRGGSTQRATPRGLDCGYRVPHLARDPNRIGPSVRQRPPRFSNVTETEAWHDLWFRADEFPRLLRAPRIPRGGASQWIHVPWGNCASSSPSHEEGVALLATREMR